jgi:carboxymethylenebutenolidase
MILVGGAASLRVPDTGGLALDDPRYVPTFVRDIALACLRQSEVCAAERQADWTYMSPPPQLVPGVRTGRYRLAQDELLLDSEGKSTISMEDFAVALLDEAESPKHHRSSFTVAADPFDTTEREFAVETPDGSADCYFIHPEHGSHPGVIIWPDVLSLRPAFQTIGKQIAQCGYAVLVINPYYRTTAAPIGIDASSFAEPAGREKAFQLAKAITPAMTASDTVALVDYLDGQEAVDSNRKLGVAGYCMGGSMAIRSAAARPDRVGAVASFHGGNLVTNEPSSPHLLVADSRANALIAIAQSDHDKEPDTQTALEEAFGGAKLPAEIEVYEGTAHGWCVPDAKAYDQPEADRALSRLLALFGTALR